MKFVETFFLTLANAAAIAHVRALVSSRYTCTRADLMLRSYNVFVQVCETYQVR